MGRPRYLAMYFRCSFFQSRQVALAMPTLDRLKSRLKTCLSSIIIFLTFYNYILSCLICFSLFCFVFILPVLSASSIQQFSLVY